MYEALRAFFLEGRPSHEVARDFGYSAGSFRVLCHAFRLPKRDWLRHERAAEKVVRRSK
jgi:hypothetical protein